jgi:hypothetical protein
MISSLMIASPSLGSLAQRVAEALVKVVVRNDSARISMPLLYASGSHVGVEIARHHNGYLVSDMGGAMREAELMGGDRQFSRIAPDAALRYGVRFDHHMMFDIDVPESEAVAAVIAVANAAKAAVDLTMLQLAARETVDLKTLLWNRLDGIFLPGTVERNVVVTGSSDTWTFDAVVTTNGRKTVFEMVSPHPAAVSSAVTKFLDLSDLGNDAPNRIAVLGNKLLTPYLAVLSRTATVVGQDDPDEVFRRAA